MATNARQREYSVSRRGRQQAGGSRQRGDTTVPPAASLRTSRGGAAWESRRLRRAAARTRRQRLAAVCAFVAAVAVTVTLAADAYAGAGPSCSYARAVLGDLAGRPLGFAAVTATLRGPAREARADGDGEAVAWRHGQVSVASSIVDGRLRSRSAAFLEGLSLFGGRVTADAVAVTVIAESSTTSAGTRVARCTLSGLKIDGAAVSVRDLPQSVPGLGIVTALSRTRRAVDGRAEVVLTGLRVRLVDGWRRLPAGSEVVVGSVAAGADTATAASLLARLAPPEPRPTPAAAGGGSETRSRDGGANDSGDAPVAGGRPFKPGPMSPPGDLRRTPVPVGPAVFPVAGRFWYGHDWHAPRATGRRHLGCDVFARRGTPLVAVQDGVVTRLLTLSLGGVSLRLVNDRDDYFYYAHLLRYAPGLSEGARVRKGQVIGFVGNSGNARTTPPHLHFEVHPYGGPAVDPFPYLELWRGARVALRGTRETPRGAREPRPARRDELVTRARRSHGHAPPPAPAAKTNDEGAPGATVALSVALLALVAAGAPRLGRRRPNTPYLDPPVKRPRDVPRAPA